MKQSLLLFLSANNLYAQRMAGDLITEQQEFPDSDLGRQQFNAFLESIKCTTYLLTDLIEEDFRHELVPHLVGGNRAALLKRKFDQYYRGTPFRQATLLYRQKSGRRDDDILFSALTNPALISYWLDVILAQQIPLAGIYSVPQISAPLVKKHPSKHLLLVTWEKYSGLRQTYFSNHHLQISRLTPVHTDLTFDDAVEHELARTFQYLKNLSLLPAGQTLDVLILCHNNDRSKLEIKLPKTPDMQYDFTDIVELGKTLKLKYRFVDSDATQIFLHQLTTLSPKNNYANPTHTHYLDLARFKNSLYLASGIFLFCAILWGTDSLIDSRNNATVAAELEALANQDVDEVKRVTSAFPNTYAPATDMKTGVSVMRKLTKYSPTPFDVLSPISKSLERYPQIQLDELSWEMNPAEPVAKNTSSDVPAQVAILKGRMVDFGNDYRSVLNYLTSFEQDLINQGYQVKVLAKPFDVSPSGNITDQRENLSNELFFSIRISRRPNIVSSPDNNRPPT